MCEDKFKDMRDMFKNMYKDTDEDTYEDHVSEDKPVDTFLPNDYFPDQECIDTLLRDLYNMAHDDKDALSITVNLDIKYEYMSDSDIYGSVKTPNHKYRILSFPLTENQIKKIHALDYNEFLLQFTPLIKNKMREMLRFPENLSDMPKFSFARHAAAQREFIFPGEFCVYAGAGRTSTPLEDIVNVLKLEEQLRNTENVIYFLIATENRLYIYAGLLMSYDENINITDKHSFLQYVPSFADCFSTHYIIGHTKVNCAIPLSHEANFPTLFEFNSIYVCKLGYRGFLAQVPMNLSITETPSDEDRNIIYINLKMTIGSPEFHDRISDLPDADKQRSIDRLLTRAFQQRIEQD